MSFVKLEDLPELTLATTTLLYGEKTPYTALADAGKIPLSLLDARYLQKTGGIMTGDLDMNGNLIENIEQATFNPTPATSTGIGQLQWNNDDGTLEVGALGGNVVLQIGQENHIYVVQKTGDTMANGKSVILIGASGERPEVTLTNIPFGNPIDLSVGITTESIDNNQEGYITTFGLVRDINTSMWAEGAIIWADPDTPGDLTDVRPTAPDRPVLIGIVIRSHASLGSLYVSPVNVSNLTLLADVFPDALVGGSFPYWNAGNSRFEFDSVLTVSNTQMNLSTFLEMVEGSLPAAGAANTGRLFMKDNGSGKTQFGVRFATGAEQIMATEP